MDCKNSPLYRAGTDCARRNIFLACQSKNGASVDRAKLRRFFAKTSVCDIAHTLGISHQRVHQIYNKYVRNQYCKGLTITELQGPTVRVRQKRVTPIDPSLKVVAMYARRAGVKVEGVWQLNNTYSKKYLLLNGVKCLVSVTRRLTKTSSMTKRLYYTRSVSLKLLRETPFLVVLGAAKGYEPNCYVIPCDQVLEAYSAKGPYLQVYLPTKREPLYNNMKPRLDWWQYHNAWHLLK